MVISNFRELQLLSICTAARPRQHKSTGVYMLDEKPTIGDRILVFGNCQVYPSQEIEEYPNYRIPSIISHRDKPHHFAMCEARVTPWIPTQETSRIPTAWILGSNGAPPSC
jgi:hypothetical protein